jgi:hypothetical protein
MSKSVTRSGENIKQMIIDSLKDIEWDVMQGKTDAVMAKLEEAQKLTRGMDSKKNIELSLLDLQTSLSQY